jgi:hypothetical protein
MQTQNSKIIYWRCLTVLTAACTTPTCIVSYHYATEVEISMKFQLIAFEMDNEISLIMRDQCFFDVSYFYFGVCGPPSTFHQHVCDSDIF